MKRFVALFSVLASFSVSAQAGSLAVESMDRLLSKALVSQPSNDQFLVMIADAAALNRQISDQRSGNPPSRSTLLISQGAVTNMGSMSPDTTFCLFVDRTGSNTLINGMNIQMEGGIDEEGDFIGFTSDQGLILMCAMARQSRTGYQLGVMDIRSALGSMASFQKL